MQVHEEAAHFRQQTRVDRGAVNPRAGAARSDLALENDGSLLDIDPVLVEDRLNLRTIRDVERALDRRTLSAGADQIGRRALAEKQSERSDDDRLARPCLSGEH